MQAFSNIKNITSLRRLQARAKQKTKQNLMNRGPDLARFLRYKRMQRNVRAVVSNVEVLNLMNQWRKTKIFSIFVISIDKNTLQTLTKRFGKMLNLYQKNVESCDARTYTRKELVDIAKTDDSCVLTKGRLGCFISHMRCLRSFAFKGKIGQRCLIMEDDAEINSSMQFWRPVVNFTTKSNDRSWDILFVCRNPYKDYKFLPPHHRRFTGRYIAFKLKQGHNVAAIAYIINGPKSAQKILKHIQSQKVNRPFDTLLAKGFDLFINAYAFTPNLGFVTKINHSFTHSIK